MSKKCVAKKLNKLETSKIFIVQVSKTLAMVESSRNMEARRFCSLSLQLRGREFQDGSPAAMCEYAEHYKSYGKSVGSCGILRLKTTVNVLLLLDRL